MYFDIVGFMPGMKKKINTKRSIDIKSHINRMKGEKPHDQLS